MDRLQVNLIIHVYKVIILVRFLNDVCYFCTKTYVEINQFCICKTDLFNVSFNAKSCLQTCTK